MLALSELLAQRLAEHTFRRRVRHEREGTTKRQIGSYRRPGQSGYARGSWWTGHAAELIGGVAGFAFGFVLYVIGRAAGVDLDWLPWLTLIGGAIGTRVLVLRQFRR